MTKQEEKWEEIRRERIQSLIKKYGEPLCESCGKVGKIEDEKIERDCRLDIWDDYSGIGWSLLFLEDYPLNGNLGDITEENWYVCHRGCATPKWVRKTREGFRFELRRCLKDEYMGYA